MIKYRGKRKFYLKNDQEINDRILGPVPQLFSTALKPVKLTIAPLLKSKVDL
jgi:hypothetical protein